MSSLPIKSILIILLPSDITNDGSISGTHYVASGIYTANYDSNTNRYIGVVLNIE
jgi:hypothetical protein